MDDSSASSTTARNLRLSHAIAVAQRAVEADDAGVLDGDEGALALYEQAARALLGCLKAEPSAARRQLLRAKVNDLLYRAEELHRADGAATAAAAASASAAAGAGDGEVVVDAPAAGAGAPAPAAEAAGGEPAEPAAAVVDAVAAARSGLLGSSTGDSAAESRAAAVAAAAAAESRAARYAHLEQLAAESQAVPAEAVPGSGDEDSLGSSSTSMVEAAHPEFAAAGGGAAAADDDDDDDDARVACDVVFNVDGVECFSVLSAAGERQRIAGPGTLQLLRVEGAPGLMLLRLEQFEFPLRVNIPCLRSARGMYVVPLASSGVCYAFAFPAQIHDAFLTAFEALLAPACQFRVSAGSDQPRGDVPAAATDAAAAAAGGGGGAGGAPATSGSGSAAGAGAAGVDAASASPAAAAEAAADPGDFIDDDPTQQQQQALAVPGEGQPGSKVLVAADTTARGVTVASTYLVAGIQKGSEIVAGGVAKGGTAIKSRVGTAEKPLEVPEGVSRTVAAAKVVSPAVVNLSKALVKGLAVLAEEVGSAVATQIVERTRNESTGETAFDSPGAQAAKKVAGSVIVGVVDVWDALEDAGKTVLVQTKESTVDIVDHRWGTEAASVTGDSMDVVIDGYQTVRNVKSVGVKKIAKKVTKETVKETGRLYLGDSETADLRQRKRDELMITDAPKGDDSDDDAESFAASATAAARALDPHKLLEITRGRKGADSSSSGAGASSGGAEQETTPTQQETAPTPATPATPASPDEVTPTPSPAVGL